jgi:hypothetical protein
MFSETENEVPRDFKTEPRTRAIPKQDRRPRRSTRQRDVRQRKETANSQQYGGKTREVATETRGWRAKRRIRRYGVLPRETAPMVEEEPDPQPWGIREPTRFSQNEDPELGQPEETQEKSPEEAYLANTRES